MLKVVQSHPDLRYQDLLKSTEEPMGEPIDNQLAQVVKTIWGKADDKEKNKEFRKILIPRNCEILKTPRLNAEAYIKINNHAQDRDRSAQAKQKDIVRSTVPILQAMEKLKNVERDVKKHIPREHRNAPWVEKYVQNMINRIHTISPHLHRSLILQNCAFSEYLKKRKGDVCSTLGSDFAAYKNSTSTNEWLFDDETVKKMKSDLKKVTEKKKYNNFHTTTTKNSSSSYKPQRSFQKGSNNNSNYKRSYQNNNYNQNKNNNYNQNKNGQGSGPPKRK